MRSDVMYCTGIRKIIQDVQEKPALFAVFTAYKTLALMMFMGEFFFSGTFQVGEFALPTLVLFLLVCAGVCLFFALHFKKIKAFDKNGYLWFVAGCMILGVFFLFMESHAGISSDIFRFATFALGIVFLGVGVMGIHVELGRIFGMLGMTPTLTYGIASVLAAAVLALGISCLPSFVQWALAFVLPGIIVLAFYFARIQAFPEQKVLYRESSDDLLIPWRFMITSLTQGFALGMPLGFLSFSGFFGNTLTSAGYFLAAAVAFVVVLALRMDFNRSVYQIGFPLAACGLLAVGVGGSTAAFSAVLQVAGFIYLDLVLWGLGSYLIKNCNQPATWVASCPSTALMLGRALGVVVGSIAMQTAITNAEHIAAFFSVMAFLVMLVALLLSNNANLQTGWGFVRPGDPSENTGKYRTCQIIAEDFGLTQRELEIMQHMVEGVSRKEMAEALFVTPNTVKTHVHNLYNKLDVHSESDLKLFVIKREKMFSSTDESAASVPDEL